MRIVGTERALRIGIWGYREGMRVDDISFQIQFVGEEGEDEGGMAKEFFMLLTQRILNPDFGMFMEDEVSHLMWFREGVSHVTCK